MLLFEFDDFKDTNLSPAELKGFKHYLDTLWQNRLVLFEEKSDSQTQPFFLFDGSRIKAQNYAGQIQYKDLSITVLPKIFKQQAKPDIQNIFKHLLFYLSFCQRLRFSVTWQDTLPTDLESFSDLYIFWFSTLTKQALSEQPYQRFEESTQETEYLRGKLKTNPYIQKNVIKGNWQKFHAQHQPLLYDNLFNRIIKYTASVLTQQTQNTQILDNLHDILELLKEVKDTFCKAEDCHKLTFNTFYQTHQQVIHFCYYILSQQQGTPQEGTLKHFSFMLPMEIIFEDFLSGFIEKHFPEQNPVRQSKKYFAKKGQKPVFLMKSDLVLKKTNLVIDFKYKLLNPQNTTLGVSEKDLYQVFSYVSKRNTPKGILIYPCSVHRKPMAESFNIDTTISKTEIKIQEVEIYQTAFNQLTDILFNQLKTCLGV